MKERILWKSWYLMSQEEQNKFLNDGDLLACYLDNYHEDYDTYVKEEFEDYCQEVNNDYFENDFGEDGNWAYSPLKNQEVEVHGILGLWDGKHKVVPRKFNNLNKAISACLEDYNIIVEDSYGNLIISAYHHDGQNKFVIKKSTPKGPRCLHFCKTVFGTSA